LPARERNIALVERFFQLPKSKNLLALLPKPLLNIKNDELALVNRFTDTWASTNSHLPMRPILVFSGSKWINKSYPIRHLLNAVQIVNSKAPRRIIFMAGSLQEEQVLRQQVTSFGYEVLFEPHLVVLQHLIKQAALVIGMDSMPIHLAQAASVPVFGLFGPTKMDIYLLNETGLEGEKKTYGYAGTCPYSVEFTRRCPRLRSCKTGACIRQVDPNMVAESLAKCWPKVSLS
jgi:heptosyltransferase-1